MKLKRSSGKVCSVGYAELNFTYRLLYLTTGVAVHKDLQLQIQFLEERLASRRAGRKSGRRSVNPSSPMPTKNVKEKEKEVSETLPPAPSAVVTANREDLQNAEDKSCDKASVISAEEATDRFIAELKKDISMRMPSGTLSIILDQIQC